MPYYEEDIIEQVRSASDIVDIIGQYVKLQKKGANYVGLCPFHNEKTGSFSVSQSKQMYHCFGCGAGGNVFTFLQEYENYSFPEAMSYLADRARIELPKHELTNQQRQAADEREKLLELNKKAATYFYSMLRSEKGTVALEYFKARELSEDTIKKFGLGYALKYSDDLYTYLKSRGASDLDLQDSGLVSIDEVHGGRDKFWNRAMFPIMDINNHVIAFGGRVLGEGKPKYLNSQETKVFNKRSTLYGLNFARRSHREGMLLCEGYMDVIALHQVGCDNAIASLGTAFTEAHANILKRYTKIAYLTFDSDDAGIKAALRTIPMLNKVGITSKIVHMDPYKDPDEFIKAMGVEAYEERIDQAENAFLFQIRMEEVKYQLKDPGEKTKFQKMIVERLLNFEEEVERNNYLEAVCTYYGFSRDEMYRYLVHVSGGRRYIPSLEQEEQENRPRRKKDNPRLMAQKLLLTWLVEYPKLYEQVSNYIELEDFTSELYRKVAEKLIKQIKEAHINPAQIIGEFEEDEQAQVAALFSARLEDVETDQEKNKALRDVIRRVKTNSYELQLENMTTADMGTLQHMVEAKKKLEEMNKLTLNFV